LFPFQGPGGEISELIEPVNGSSGSSPSIPARQSQQRKAGLMASLHQLTADLNGKGMGGINHSPKGPELVTGPLKLKQEFCTATEGTHQQLKTWMDAVGAGRFRTHDTDPQRPALVEQLHSQGGAISSAAKQPKPLGR
jgi:hypothetical protein